MIYLFCSRTQVSLADLFMFKQFYWFVFCSTCVVANECIRHWFDNGGTIVTEVLLICISVDLETNKIYSAKEDLWTSSHTAPINISFTYVAKAQSIRLFPEFVHRIAFLHFFRNCLALRIFWWICVRNDFRMVQKSCVR